MPGIGWTIVPAPLGSASAMSNNRQWRLKAHPRPGEIIGPQHFELVAADIPDIGPDEFLVRTLVLGTSPAQRGYTDPTSMQPGDLVCVGEIMRGRGIGVVAASHHPDYQPGDWVSGSLGWQEWSVQRLGRGLVKTMNVLSVQKVDESLRPSALHLGTLGTAAFTALCGLEDIGEIAPGKTVVISAAAGGVGSMATQIARAHGCRVVGIAGGPEKCAWLQEYLGCDVAIDYKNANVATSLPAACPDGIDIYFDNVGGAMLDTVLQHLADGARVVICGFISMQYQAVRPPGPTWYTRLLNHRARMEGFITWDHVARFPEFFAKLRSWYEEGTIKPVEDISDGIETAPDALRSLFTGGNRGIRLIRVSDDPPP
jgi:NADPH-dependent curcumin reductase CurA